MHRWRDWSQEEDISSTISVDKKKSMGPDIGRYVDGVRGLYKFSSDCFCRTPIMTRFLRQIKFLFGREYFIVYVPVNDFCDVLILDF